MANILVTGANGQLGSELRALAAQHPEHQFRFTDRTDLDITDAQKVDAAFTQFKPDYCLNCAAYTAVDKAESEEAAAFRINAEAVKNLAAACTTHNTRFLHVSTDYVFDGGGTEPYKEDYPTAPISVYGHSKLAGEENARAQNKEAIIIRTSWVYSQYGHNFVKTMLRVMPVRDEVGVVADQFGSPTYAADLAEALLQIVEWGTWIPGIYHYSNAGVISWHQFAEAIKKHAGLQSHVKALTTAEYPTPVKRPAYSVMDTSKIQSTFGIVPKKWEESLQRCLQKLKEASA